eukprot:TRINITY_DN1236_c0_g1_i2.p1 TRINITY_DN1236_c0_g1~~TRINITY_DN1236_c0_g1_i2.p1  ORF type:complete len:101 (+),score=20.36 TRINITY_DN1236_c0_g1_i2:69-371(+)
MCIRDRLIASNDPCITRCYPDSAHQVYSKMVCSKVCVATARDRHYTSLGSTVCYMAKIVSCTCDKKAFSKFSGKCEMWKCHVAKTGFPKVHACKSALVAM